MARTPKPWWRKDRESWYVTIAGKRYDLGPDRGVALKRFHELMARPAQRRKVSAGSVAAVIDTFLEWCKQHRAADTYEWYRQRLQLFIATVPPSLRVEELRPFHVQCWIDGCSGVSTGTLHNYCRSIQRAMRWAEQQGYIERSPIAHLEKPKAGKREIVVSLEEFDAILACVRDREFQDLLMVTWDTGARPQESLHVEARHVDLEHGRWVIPAAEAKVKTHTRIVYLTDEALAITKRLMVKYPEGKLFRNTRGVAWTTDAVNNRFCTIQVKLGTKYCLYALRHSWATHALKSGIDAMTVAVLLGHCDPSTLARTYQHLSQSPEYLRKAAQRVSA